MIHKIITLLSTYYIYDTSFVSNLTLYRGVGGSALAYRGYGVGTVISHVCDGGTIPSSIRGERAVLSRGNVAGADPVPEMSCPRSEKYSMVRTTSFSNFTLYLKLQGVIIYFQVPFLQLKILGTPCRCLGIVFYVFSIC